MLSIKRVNEERHKSRKWSVSEAASFHLSLSTFLFLFIFIFTSCNSDRKTFLLEGSFKGFNQGELYIYGINGTHRLDTIGVAKGHFRYEIALEEPTIFSLVFPNFSELPVFGDTQAEVEIEGDASHLKETTIKGTDQNKQMTAFRMRTSQMTPPQLTAEAEKFIHENPASPISLYLLNKYFTQTPSPDYQKAIKLIGEIQKAQPDEPALKGLAQKMKGLTNLKDGARLPVFTARDINGKTVKSADLNAQVNVITVWAKWNYESVSMQRQLRIMKDQYKEKLGILSICLDADIKECRKSLENDSVPWSTVCDGRMWETSLLQQTGLSFVPDNIVTDSKGKVIAHTLKTNELQKKIRELLDKSD